ncbi:MAG TPA: hypothetical protein PLB22_06105, partial [Ottowia sp.]|nr:hypothetical protein [Ottowia sp.]
MTTAPSSAPDTAAAALTRAAQAWQAGAWGQVIALLTPWVDATPSAPEALQLIAMAHLKLGQMEPALDRQRQLTRLQPG